MSNYLSGHNAEKRAAVYLEEKGYEILELNWKTRWCEIDIVAKKDKVIYFVEVKFRRSLKYGHGLDYITTKKIRQMAFAAEFWVTQNKWSGDYELAGLGLDSDNYEFVTVA